MSRKKRICIFVTEELYDAIRMTAEYNGYNDVAEFIRAVVRWALVQLRTNKVLVLPVAALPPQLGSER